MKHKPLTYSEIQALSAGKLPVRVVVLVSEQLMPTLAFVLHAAQRWGRRLASVHIYCTHDQRRSAEPAERLKLAVLKWTQTRQWPLTVEVTKGGMQPVDVRKGLLNWFNAHPESHWLVNVTGGNKLMSAAAIELCLAADLTECRVMYKEIAGPWMELSLNPESNLLQTQALDPGSDPDVPAPDALDTLMPLADLVAVQFSAAHRPSTQDVHSLPLIPILESVQRTGWNWLNGFASATLDAGAKPIPTPTNSGDGFERFIAAGLQSCGVRVRHSLKLHDIAGADKPMREIDVVAYHGGKLVCIDIKLPAAADTAKGTQLADIAELTKSLGGPAAVAIALRPGWPDDAEISRLASVLNVRLLTRTHAPQVFTHLLKQLDGQIKPSSEVLDAESQLMAWAQTGLPVLSDSRSLPPNSINELGLLSVGDLLQEMAFRQQRCWALARLPGGKLLVWVEKKSDHSPAWLQVNQLHLEMELKKMGDWMPLSRGSSIISGLLWPRAQLKSHEISQTLGKLLKHTNN